MNESKTRPRILFVDDEPSIRLTLPSVLQEAGFEVRVSDSVSDALFEINTNAYDVLISDLNIGEDGDGFLVVSAMRHVQPACTNFILTGYPAFETALQAIHNQVDDYLVKPVEVDSLIKSLRERFETRRSRPAGARLSSLLKENVAQIARLARASGDKQCAALADDELSKLVTSMIEQLELEREQPAAEASRSAAEFGKLLKQQGQSVSGILGLFRCLSDAVYAVVQANLTTTADIMNLLSDLRRFNQRMSTLVEKSVEAYSKRKPV